MTPRKLDCHDRCIFTRKAGTFSFKGDCLDFSHLTKLKYIYITEMYMKKQYKSSKNIIFDGVPL